MLDTAQEAAAAYDAKAQELSQLDGKATRLNFGAGGPATNAAGNPVSRYRGVSWNSAGGRWHARTSWYQGGKQQWASAGYHASDEAAARAHDAKAIEVLGLARALCRLNFPPPAGEGQAAAAAAPPLLLPGGASGSAPGAPELVGHTCWGHLQCSHHCVACACVALLQQGCRPASIAASWTRLCILA